MPSAETGVQVHARSLPWPSGQAYRRITDSTAPMTAGGRPTSAAVRSGAVRSPDLTDRRVLHRPVTASGWEVRSGNGPGLSGLPDGRAGPAG